MTYDAHYKSYNHVTWSFSFSRSVPLSATLATSETPSGYFPKSARAMVATYFSCVSSASSRAAEGGCAFCMDAAHPGSLVGYWGLG